MEIKYKVFISSTYEDMKNERDIVFQTLLKNGYIVGGMELFTGDNIEKFEVIKRDIQDCDVFVLILGGRYGTICSETDKSFIEMEYDYAKSLGIPVGVIAIHKDFLDNKKKEAYAKHKTYYDEGTKNCQKFYQKVATRMITYYSNYTELNVNLIATVNRICSIHNVSGWIRCDYKNMQSYLSKINDNDFIKLSKRTIVNEINTTEKDQYRISNLLFYDNNSMEIAKLKTIFLMQRSSSIVLGAESGWRAEKTFLNSLLEAVNKCDDFYHIITIEGIENHLKRKGSIFPDFHELTKNFINIDGYAAIKKENEPSGGVLIKKLPKEGSNPLFKLDRQVRLVAVEKYDGTTEGVFVWNIGKDESCMRVSGDKMKAYLKQLITYYNEFDYVLWNELEDLYNRYS